MFHHAKESGEEQELGTNDLKFSELSVISVTTMETLVVFHGMVEPRAQKRKVPVEALTLPRVSPGADAAEQPLLTKSPASL